MPRTLSARAARSPSALPEPKKSAAPAGAFVAMRARIERAIEQRTMMLSGVSHDLRTPLTRMKLTLALSPPTEEVDQLNRDVSEMEKMLDAFLAFAQGDQPEEPTTVDLVDLCEDLVDQTRRSGVDVNFTTAIEPDLDRTMPLRDTSIRRALGNLLANAGRYGNQARLTLSMTARSVSFVVEDNGPGIPPERREDVLRPFVRLDKARNQDKGGGVGLGLAIALDAARVHGGVLELGDSADLGGLRATMRLPR